MGIWKPASRSTVTVSSWARSRRAKRKRSRPLLSCLFLSLMCLVLRRRRGFLAPQFGEQVIIEGRGRVHDRILTYAWQAET